MDEICSECDLCEKPIYYGNAMVSVNRNIEQVDRTEEYPDGEVTVIDSDQLLTLCASCGNRFSTEYLRELITVSVKTAAHPQ